MKSPSHNSFNAITVQSGFTLVELVISVVISGILAVGTISYISGTVDEIDSARTRNQLASAGRTAIDRLALELHNALPNSIRVKDITAGGRECIEFVSVLGATTYINPSFGGSNLSSFTVVDFIENALVTIPANANGVFGVIYPRTTARLYLDGENAPVRSTLHSITSIVDITSPPSAASIENLTTINIDPAGRYRRRSPNERFFVVSQPVSFCVVGDKLYRYSNYGFLENQTVSELPGGGLPNYTSVPDKVLITDSINNFAIPADSLPKLAAFTVGNQNLARNSLVAIQLRIRTDSETVLLKHEVLSRSVP
jgi:MSHA biogenesis protein MshO